MNKKLQWDAKGKRIELLEVSKEAVDEYISDIRKGIDKDATGSARKQELQSLKEAIISCRELIEEIDRIEEQINEGNEAAIKKEEEVEFPSGFAEQNAG